MQALGTCPSREVVRLGRRCDDGHFSSLWRQRDILRGDPCVPAVGKLNKEPRAIRRLSQHRESVSLRCTGEPGEVRAWTHAQIHRSSRHDEVRLRKWRRGGFRLILYCGELHRRHDGAKRVAVRVHFEGTQLEDRPGDAAFDPDNHQIVLVLSAGWAVKNGCGAVLVIQDELLHGWLDLCDPFSPALGSEGTEGHVEKLDRTGVPAEAECGQPVLRLEEDEPNDLVVALSRSVAYFGLVSCVLELVAALLIAQYRRLGLYLCGGLYLAYIGQDIFLTANLIKPAAGLSNVVAALVIFQVYRYLTIPRFSKHFT